MQSGDDNAEACGVVVAPVHPSLLAPACDDNSCGRLEFLRIEPSDSVDHARGILKKLLDESRHGSAWHVAATGLGADWRTRARSRARRDSDRHGKGRA